MKSRHIPDKTLVLQLLQEQKIEGSRNPMYYLCDYAVLERWSDSSHCRGMVFATGTPYCAEYCAMCDSSHCRGMVFATYLSLPSYLNVIRDSSHCRGIVFATGQKYDA